MLPKLDGFGVARELRRKHVATPILMLTARSADSFTNETPSGDEEIRLTLTLDNENYPTLTLAFYRYNGTLCLAEADGIPACGQSPGTVC